LSTMHFLKFPENKFEVLKLLEHSVKVLKNLENKLESMRILENKLESMRILENKLESLKLQENQQVDGLWTVAESRERAENEPRTNRESRTCRGGENEPSQKPKTDGGGEDPSRPPPTSFGCAGCFINRGKGKRKPNLGGVKAGRKTGERPGNQKVPAGDKARLMATLGVSYPFILRITSSRILRSERWPSKSKDNSGLVGKSYNTTGNLEEGIGSEDPETGAYDLDRSGGAKPMILRLPADEGVERRVKHTTAEITRWSEAGKLRGPHSWRGLVMPGYVRSRLSYTAPVDRSRDVDFMMSLMRSDNRFADAFARYDSGGASGSGGSRARDSEGGEDGDDTGGEDGGDDTNFFRKKSGNAAVQAVYKKNCRLFPSDMSLGKIPLKDKTLEVKSVEKRFPSDMSLGNILPPWHQFLDQKIRGAHFSLGIVAGERFAIELTPSTFPQRHFAGDMFPQRHVAGKRVGMLLGKPSNVVVYRMITHNRKWLICIASEGIK
ncbi:hypothetical protein Tco_0328522, partial [Tanacetum coccineum]